MTHPLLNKIAKVRVNWMEGYANDPQLVFVFKRDAELVPLEEFRYDQIKNTFYAVKDDEVQYYTHNRNDHNGFASRQFHLHMADSWDASQWKDCCTVQYDYGARYERRAYCTLKGRILTLTGPWSSGASYISKLIGPVVHVSVLTGSNRETIRNPQRYHWAKRRGRAYEGLHYAADFTLEAVQAAIDKYAPHLEMYEGDYGWYPVRKGDTPKNPRRGRVYFNSEVSDEQARIITL